MRKPILFGTNKYSSIRVIKRGRAAQQEDQMVGMLSPCGLEASEACTNAFCTAPFLGSSETADHIHRHTTTTTTTRDARSNFSKFTASSLYPNTKFTNHESLPTLPNAFTTFTAAYPKYSETQLADLIRVREYHHLSDQVCLDYTGFCLFSHAQMQPSPSSSPLSPSDSPPHLFDISYKPVSLNSQAQHGNQETAMQSAIRKRIMVSLNISDDEYTMVCTASRNSAFNLLAESYPFHPNKRLLTVYDHDSEAVSNMAESARKRGARAMSASFSWPSLKIHAAKLKKMVMNNRKKKGRGLFVFPLQSTMSGARYPYLWMTLARQNGWHVVLDACALGAKDMDAFGLSLIEPDFIICSFFKVFGENPSGFAGLFIKKASSAVLQPSAMARSIGVVGIVPARMQFQLPNDLSDTDLEAQPPKLQFVEDDVEGLKRDESSEDESEIVEIEKAENNGAEIDKSVDIHCRGLDHADSMGLRLICSRLRYITNWLVVSLMKLRHPHSDNGHSLVRIYGPRVKFDRAPAVSFNVFDWKGEKIEPSLVQKLADRSNISLSCVFLHNVWFSAKYKEHEDAVMERRVCEMTVGGKRRDNIELGVNAVNASLGFLTNFEDAYRLWVFVAKFLDADFVEKERWRHVALNRRTFEVQN